MTRYRTWKGPTGETLDGTNNAFERAIGWWIKERYRTMRGYKVPKNAVRVSRRLSWCGNFLTEGRALGDAETLVQLLSEIGIDADRERALCRKPAADHRQTVVPHELFGHQRFIGQIDIGGMPFAEVAQAIELLGTEVAPVVCREMAKAGQV